MDATEVVVVRAPDTPADLRCGGHPMIPLDAAPTAGASPSSEHAAGTLIGKRYVDEAVTLELLCTKAGPGSLSIGDEALVLKEAKPLPASD